MKKLTSLMIIMSFVFLSVSLASAADIPMMLNYQGYVKDSFGVPVNGNGYFKFALVDDPNGTGIYWSNDGGDDPNAVTIPVTDGFFSIKLGDTKMSNMSALPPSVFDQQNIFVRVWFSTDNETFDLLSKDTQIVSSGFAYKAQTVADNTVTSTNIEDDSITNVDISSDARIEASKTDFIYKLPIAYGIIDFDGTPIGSTGISSCNWHEDMLWYEIEITDENYSMDSYITIVTPIQAGVSAQTMSIVDKTGEGKLIVKILNAFGAKVQSKFCFVTYKPKKFDEGL